MNSKAKRNTNGLLNHTNSIKRETEEKVNQAIDTLKRSRNREVNFKSVSRLSGISTTTLYNNPILRERIKSLRALKASTTQETSASAAFARDQERSLRQEIQKLKEEKHMLITQLVEYERLKAENKQLKTMLKKHHN
jgi:hypothetical protein